LQCQKVDIKLKNILIYNYLKTFIAALNLFTKHAEQFDEYIYDDYESLFTRITNWAQHKNYDLKKLAYSALDPFYKQVN
jgi:hypothetical protein